MVHGGHVMLHCVKCNFVGVFNNSFHMFLDHTECPIEGQVFSECKGCDGTCEQPIVPCPAICLPGCSCPVGTVVHEGRCIPLEQCPPSGECCSDTRSKTTRLWFMASCYAALYENAIFWLFFITILLHISAPHRMSD